MTYMVPMQHGWLWFPDRPGLITGIIIGGFGLGAFVFNFVCTGLVNPDNEKPVDGRFSDEVNGRVHRMLVIFTLSCICIVTVSSMLIYPGRDPVSKKEVKSRMQEDALSNLYEPPEV